MEKEENYVPMWVYHLMSEHTRITILNYVAHVLNTLEIILRLPTSSTRLLPQIMHLWCSKRKNVKRPLDPDFPSSMMLLRMFLWLHSGRVSLHFLRLDGMDISCTSNICCTGCFTHYFTHRFNVNGNRLYHDGTNHLDPRSPLFKEHQGKSSHGGLSILLTLYCLCSPLHSVVWCYAVNLPLRLLLPRTNLWCLELVRLLGNSISGHQLLVS